MPRTATTIRLSQDERTEIEASMKRYGYTEVAPFIRFALQQLSVSKGAGGTVLKIAA